MPRTFYLANSGNDANDGLSWATAWQSLARATTGPVGGYLPGDTLFLKDGNSFQGQLSISPANVPSLGNKTNPILISSSGSSSTILANAGGTNNGSIGPRSWGVMLDAVSGVILQGLTITNVSTTQYGVMVQNSVANHVMDTVTVRLNDVSGFQCTAPGDFSAEIAVFGFAITNGNNGPINNLNVLDNILHGKDGPTSTDDAGISGFGYGQNITNAHYSGNHVYDIGGRPNNGGDGILFQGVNGGEAAYNLIHDCAGNNQACGGPVGLWAFRCNNILFHDNEVARIRHVGGPIQGACDKAAFDCDGGVTNCIYEWNYSHDNDGPAIIMFQAELPWGNNVYRYNISENDGRATSNGGGVVVLANSGVSQIYGNIIYRGNYPLDLTSTLPPSAVCSDFITVTPAAGSIVYNNIFIVNGHDQYGRTEYVMVDSASASFANVDFKANVYFGNPNGHWVDDSGEDATLASRQAKGRDIGSVLADPRLAAPGTIGDAIWSPRDHIGPRQDPRIAQAYLPLAGSPALGISMRGWRAAETISVQVDPRVV